MDKVKVAMAGLKKYHFWVLCVVVIVVALVSWTKATGDLAKRYVARKSQIDGQFSAVRGITGQSDHPNEDTIKDVQEQHGKLGDKVFAAWSPLYEQQRAANELPKVLSKEFREAFDARWGPLERFDPKDPRIQMDDAVLGEYLNHIREHFPKLLEMIDRREEIKEDDDTGTAAKPATPAPAWRPPMMAGMPGAKDQREAKPRKMKGAVDVDEEVERKLKAHLNRWETTPSTLDVLMAQEDLWVYESLLRVIRNTNNMSADPDPKKYQTPPNHKLANVKRILALDIGKEAAQGWLRTEQAAVRAGGTEDATGRGRGGMGGAIGPSPPGAIGPSPGSMGPSPPPAGPPGAHGRDPAGRGGMMGMEGPERGSPLADRYVDDKGKPVADPTQQPYAEFRMMPVSLKVIIEQKAIPKMLAECANSKMPIEVKKVRLLVTESEPLDVSAAGLIRAETGGATSAGPPGGRAMPPGAVGPTPGGGRDYGRGRGDPGRGRMPGTVERSPSGDEEEEAVNPTEPPVPVEVQGIIYIYNPADRNKLGTGAAGGAVTSGGAQPPATPPAAPAKPAAPSTPPEKGATPPPPAAKPAPGPTTPGKPAPGTPVPPGIPAAVPGAPPGKPVPGAAPAVPPTTPPAPATKGAKP